MAKDGSMLNTPPTFAWYMAGLVFQWLKRQGGLQAMGERNRAKAEKLYAAIDGSSFYRNPVAKDARSWMNVPFTLANPELDKTFLAEAKQAGLVTLEGHRSVGGMRASLYNAMPMAGVNALVDFMRDVREAGMGKESFKILTLNNISVRGLERLPRDRYEVASEIGHPDAILLRSADMHLDGRARRACRPWRARARARTTSRSRSCRKRGIPVFNAPGANANAVKELVIAGMFLAARNICQAWEYVARAARATTSSSTKRSRRARRSSSATSCRAARSA